MRIVDEKPIETIHLYVVREENPRPPLFPILFSTLALFSLFALCVFSPSRQPVMRVAFRVPAVFLPMQTFTTSVAIIPTGRKTYPARAAHGILTITNGSVISQELPKGLIFTGRTGIEVITDTAVFVPAGSANGFGLATVSVHALVSGKSGNIPSNRTTGLLAKPCLEVVIGVVKLVVKWACQFFTYSVSPLVQVTHIKLSGKIVFVDGFIVERPQPFTGK